MKTGIIIAVYGESEYLQDCIDSINSHTSDYEIFVIDTKTSEIESLAQAWNIGLEHFKDVDYYCILNDDTIVTKNWLSNMLSIFDKEQNCGLVVPVLSNFQGQRKPFELVLNKDQKVANSYEKSDYTIEEIDEISDKIQKKFAGSYFITKRKGESFCGCCMVFPKEVYEETGGFYEGYKPCYKEDSDFLYRVNFLKYKLILCEYSFIFHFAGKTGKRVNPDRDIDFDHLYSLYSKRKARIFKKELSPKIE